MLYPGEVQNPSANNFYSNLQDNPGLLQKKKLKTSADSPFFTNPIVGFISPLTERRCRTNVQDLRSFILLVCFIYSWMGRWLFDAWIFGHAHETLYELAKQNVVAMAKRNSNHWQEGLWMSKMFLLMIPNDYWLRHSDMSFLW